jgi:5-methylthioadenosine/S-adenosylhomocysteine deaminase
MTLTVTDVRVDDRVVTMRVDDGVIAEVGSGVEVANGDEVIDGEGFAAFPGLVNGHTHAAMTLFRGYGDDLALMPWLETRIWPAEAKLTADDCYWGTRLACIEMLKSGTTTFADMYWHPEAVARAAAESGVRALLCAPLVEKGPAGRSALQDDALSSLEALDGFSPLVTPMLGPHAVYTVSPSALEWIGQLARERDVGVHIHLSETRREVDDCVAAHGVRPGELADRCGLLGPRTILAHGCWLDPPEMARIGETGATITTNPVSNMKLATGRHFPYLDAVAEGVAIGLGTDGAASNNSLDLFQDMKLFALAQKFANDDPSVLPAAETLAIATGQRSPALGGHALEVGAPADFMLVRYGTPELTPGDLEANLVYAASGAVVDTVVIDGRVRMRGRHVEGEDEVLAEVRARAARLTAGE